MIAVTPRCTVLCAVSWTSIAPWNGRVFVAERLDATVGGNFQGFRPLNGPLGDGSLLNFVPTSGPDTYAINEAWLLWPGEPEVHRAQVTPGPRTAGAIHDYNGSSWNIVVQNAAGRWSGPNGRGSSNSGSEVHTPEFAAPSVPQFMPVGLATLQMFACAGFRTEDNAEPTTALFESIGFNGVTGLGGTAGVIQDLLSGDSRFTPLSSFSAVPANQPPLPTVSGPGDPIRKGIVRCAMTQRDDDVTTRELHLLGIDNGKLYHSKLSNFGPATGDAAAGTVYPYKVAAGICPVFGATAWNAQTSEILLALWGGPALLGVSVIRVALPTGPAAPGAPPTYSPMQNIPPGQLTGPFLMRDVTIAARPFRDDGQP